MRFLPDDVLVVGNAILFPPFRRDLLTYDRDVNEALGIFQFFFSFLFWNKTKKEILLLNKYQKKKILFRRIKCRKIFIRHEHTTHENHTRN